MTDTPGGLLTPELFAFMVKVCILLSETKPFDLSEAIQRLVLKSIDEAERNEMHGKAWLALKALSKLGLDSIRDWKTFLPPVQNSELQIQALGLQLFLDYHVVLVDYFVWVRMLFGAPFVHQETTGDIGVAFNEGTRSFVENLCAVRDPYRNQPDKRSDPYGIPKMLREGGPRSPCGLAEGAFWLMCCEYGVKGDASPNS
ncbi:hypothetical protein F5Y15DRAFT_421298 [Xylariaceae sp. FL0016]|nr:hypothetical protein F5Y15DRAFT_421298 [Xylariaceae sp. FL0016]